MLQLPVECFKYGSGEVQINNEGGKPYEITNLNTSGTLSLEVKGGMYPWETYALPEAVFATNVVKSLVLESLKILTRPQFILGVLYSLIRKKELDLFVKSFNRLAFRIISPYILKFQHTTLITQELQWCIFSFVHKLGISEYDADRFSEICVQIVEYDNAYRYRLLDVMSVMTKEDFKKPREAILKLKETFKGRQNPGVIADKICMLLNLVYLACFIPKINRIVKEITSQMNLENLQPKDNHLYWWCPQQQDYMFMGMSNELRAEYAKSRGWSYPEGMV